jgi:UDP-galactose transporter B1
MNPKSVIDPIFIGLVFGVWSSFLAFGYFLEELLRRFKLQGVTFSEVGFLFVSTCGYAVAARVALLMRGKKPVHISSKLPFIIATTYLLAMFCSTRALRFVSYPTQVLGKSAKALPIMLCGLAMGKRYKPAQFLSVLLIIAGVTIFAMHKHELEEGAQGHGNDLQTATDDGRSQAEMMFGLTLLFASLSFDGVTGALEDALVKRMGWKHGDGALDLMFYINLCAAPLSGALVVLSGDAPKLVAMFGLRDDMDIASDATRNDAVAPILVATVIAGCCGQLCIWSLVAAYGAVPTAITTTLRKACTVLLSIVAFGHRIGPMQAFGIALAFSGIGLKVWTKMRQHARKEAQDLPTRKDTDSEGILLIDRTRMEPSGIASPIVARMDKTKQPQRFDV